MKIHHAALALLLVASVAGQSIAQDHSKKEQSSVKGVRKQGAETQKAEKHTAQEQTAKEQTAKEQTAKEQTAKEQTAKQPSSMQHSVKKATAVYQCPMDKEVVSSEQGKCPKCGMFLEKVAMKEGTERAGAKGQKEGAKAE